MKNKANKFIASSMIVLLGGTNFLMTPNVTIAANTNNAISNTTNNEISNTINNITSNTTDNVKTGYKIFINRGPKISSNLTQKDVLIFNFKDENDISNIKIEKNDSKTGKNVDITTNKKVIISKDKKQIKIGADVLCKKGENVKIKITAYDCSNVTKSYPNSQYTTRTYTVKRLENKDSKNRYFVINGGPSISINNNSKNLATTADDAIKQAKLTFKLEDGNNVKKLQIIDMNNTNEKGIASTIEKHNFDGINKTESVNFTNFSKLKKVDGCYKIQIIATDKTGRRHTETIKMYAKSYKETVKPGYKLSINRGPRSSADLTNENTLTFNFTDENGISKVQLEKYDETTKKYIDITNNKNVTISKDKKQLKIKADVLCEKGKSANINVKVWDNTEQQHKWVVRKYVVYRLQDKDNLNRYFVINGGPRLTIAESDFKDPTSTTDKAFEQAKISVKLKDNNNVQTLQIYDNNNKDKNGKYQLVSDYKFSGKNKIELIDFSDFSKLKKEDGKYCLIMKTKDATGKEHQELIQISATYYKDASNVDKDLKE